jgi:hypothetical protein
LHAIESDIRGENFFVKELSMSVQTVAHKFVELCRQGKNFDVMRTMYAATVSNDTTFAR